MNTRGFFDVFSWGMRHGGRDWLEFTMQWYVFPKGGESAFI